MERLVLSPPAHPKWSAFLRQIESEIVHRRLLPRGGKVLVAVSGGLDSMVLLYALSGLAPAHRWQLTVGHFNHQLRGEASDADERLVRQTARALKLPAVIGHADIQKAARKAGVSLEMAGRTRRHEFLARAARRRGISRVALAHHANDQVELFFLRLLRGASGQGLAGMKWVSPSPADDSIQLIRPLLNQSKSALAKAARTGGAPFSEDATNASLEFARNRIRHELIPFLRRKYQPALMEIVPRLMELAGADSEVVLDLARKWLRARRRVGFGRLPVAVRRRIIQLQLLDFNLAPDFDLIERLRMTVDEPFSLNAAQTIRRTASGALHLQKVARSAFSPMRRRLELRSKGSASFEGLTLRWNIEKTGGAHFAPGPNREYYDADKVGGAIWLRHWQPGDRFQPIGCASSRKLQDLFVNMKIPRARRRQLVLAATSEGKIFWVEGLRLAEGFKLESATRRRLNWQWRRESAPAHAPAR